MKLLQYTALATRVLVVAVQREIGWCAYCDEVAGINHSQEFRAVIAEGVKLSEDIARAIFPQFSKIFYER